MNELEQLIKDINNSRVHWVNAWSDEPIPNRPHYLKVPPVQALVDYAAELTRKYNYIKKLAIEKGCARYNPTTGDFEFIEQKETKNEEAKMGPA